MASILTCPHTVNNYDRWEAKAEFGPHDVHHQYAIVFRTPAYFNRVIERQVIVNVALRRPSDREVSEPRQFTYLPQEFGMLLYLIWHILICLFVTCICITIFGTHLLICHIEETVVNDYPTLILTTQPVQIDLKSLSILKHMECPQLDERL